MTNNIDNVFCFENSTLSHFFLVYSQGKMSAFIKIGRLDRMQMKLGIVFISHTYVLHATTCDTALYQHIVAVKPPP